MEDEDIPSAEETPEAKAERLTGRLRGLLKEELAAYGGGEAFIGRVRSDRDEESGTDSVAKS